MPGKVTPIAPRGERIGTWRKMVPDGLARTSQRLAAAPTVTVVVPTYREAENLPHLIDRVARVRASSGLAIDLLIMDDDSRDGSVELVAARPEAWVQIIVRSAK